MDDGVWIVVSAGVGGLVGLAGGYVERTARARSDFVAAAAAWLAAIDALALAAQLHLPAAMPSAQPLGRALDWLAGQVESILGAERTETLRVLMQWPLLKHFEAARSRASEATARLVLSAPTWLLRRLEPHLDEFEAWMRHPADEELRRQWESSARPEIVRLLRRATRPLPHRLLAAASRYPLARASAWISVSKLMYRSRTTGGDLSTK